MITIFLLIVLCLAFLALIYLWLILKGICKSLELTATDIAELQEKLEDTRRIIE